MVIRQGDIHWIDLAEPTGSGPYVVIQNDLFGASRIRTVVVCALTSNLRRGDAPGNVRLRKGEASLPKASVINISQVFTVDREDLGPKIGKLSPGRVREIVAGLSLLIDPRDAPGE